MCCYVSFISRQTPKYFTESTLGIIFSLRITGNVVEEANKFLCDHSLGSESIELASSVRKAFLFLFMSDRIGRF